MAVLDEKLTLAFELFDNANAKDPNIEIYRGKEYPKELLYAHRMSDRLMNFKPHASVALQLAARSQHICRWEIPRNNYEKNKIGYIKWRNDLKQLHADKAGIILKKVGYDNDIIEHVQFLLLKKQLKKNEETQILEDIICLVFLEFYFEAFSKKNNEEKIVDILQKTWKKMSVSGQEAALKLDLSQNSLNLIQKAIEA